MKKWLAFGSIVVLSGGIMACGNEESSGGSSDNSNGDGGNEETNSYFINPKSIGPAYWTAAEEGATQAGEDLGVEVIFNAPTETSSSDQINMIQDMITNNVNGIAISPNDADAVVPTIEEALAQDINTITWDSDSPESERNYFVAPETDSELGVTFAEEAATQMGGEGQLAFMVAGLGAQNQIDRVDAAEAYLNENYPDIEVVTTVASDDDQQQAYNNAENLLNTYPDLDGVIGFAGGEPPAAAQAVEQAINDGRLEEGDVSITGFAVPSLVDDYIENGVIEKIITWDPSALGYVSVYTLHELAQGNDIPEGAWDIPDHGEVTVEDGSILTGTTELTEENIDEFNF